MSPPERPRLQELGLQRVFIIGEANRDIVMAIDHIEVANAKGIDEFIKDYLPPR